MRIRQGKRFREMWASCENDRSIMMENMKETSTLILLRHGQSEWNKRNLFTGWVDVPLSREGIEEAQKAGKRFSAIPFDCIFTSSLIRSQLTAMIAMSEHREGKTPIFQRTYEEKKWQAWNTYNEGMKKETIPVFVAWEINERMYGELQGFDKDEMREKYGKEQVKIWRRSFDIAPPNGESLEMTAKRVIPYFQKVIYPYLKAGKNVFVSAHGNSLRSIVMYIDHLSKEEVLQLEIPTGKPLCYSYFKGSWQKKEIDEIQKNYISR